MGCCLGCTEPHEGEILAEYNPMILGDSVSETSRSMYTERMIECAERFIQPGAEEMRRSENDTEETIREALLK